ncbi:hypothetical protein AB1Y20_007814 [Prymnesium parvum]|uniref:Uncharacterized protein n=1 Tax=Prymnesium parvum TaxID=97485 RepID=A0AB34ISX5_PRYPA
MMKSEALSLPEHARSLPPEESEAVEEVAVKEAVKEVEVKEVEVKEVEVKVVVREVAVKEVAVKEVVKQVVVKEAVVKEVEVKEVVKEVVVKEAVVKEVEVKEVVKEAVVKEVVKEAVKEAVKEMKVVKEAAVKGVEVKEVVKEAAVKEVVKEVAVKEVVKEVEVKEAVKEVAVKEVVKEVAVKEVVKEVAVKEVVKEVAVKEVVKEVEVKEVVKEGTTQRFSSAVDTKWCSDEGYFVALQGVCDPSGICKTFSAELPPYEVTPAIDGTSQTDEKEKAKVVHKEAKGACSKCLKQGNLDPRSWLGDAAGPSVSLRGGYTPPSRCGSWRVVMPRYISARDGSVTFAQQVHVGQTACSRHPLASFSFICATYYGISGEHGMSMMAEKLSEALGWIPSLGIVGGPEFGTTASSTVTGGFTTSSIIFGAELNGLDEANAFMHVS